jgi:YHS domain-containing protein
MKYPMILFAAALTASLLFACSQPAPPAEPVKFPPIVSGGGMAPVDAASAVKVPEGGFALDIDPICEMKVKGEPVAATFEFEGKTYGFCSVYCKESFEKEPKKYLDRLAKAAATEQP